MLLFSSFWGTILFQKYYDKGELIFFVLMQYKFSKQNEPRNI